jgi:hypothetical protein
VSAEGWALLGLVVGGAVLLRLAVLYVEARDRGRHS